MDYNKLNISSVSYIGHPVSNTAMYIAKKVEHLLVNLENCEKCLVFCEDTISVPDSLLAKHNFIFTENPQLEYSVFADSLAKDIEKKMRLQKYRLTDEGYYIGESVIIGENAYIEPYCLIGHDVVIGKNARILSGAKIKNAIIGDNILVNENAVIGTNGFTMARDSNNNLIRIPTLGKVHIGNNVEIGMLANVAVGSAGNTTIMDNVKIDAFVYIGHDAILHDNVEITAGAIVGGFDNIGMNTFIGINATLRNRITIGDNAVIGMGSVVTKSIEPNTTVIGNPAKVYEK